STPVPTTAAAKPPPPTPNPGRAEPCSAETEPCSADSLGQPSVARLYRSLQAAERGSALQVIAGKKIPSSPGLRRGNMVYGFRGLDYIIGAGADGIATGAAFRFAGRRAFLAAFFLAGRLAALRAVFFAVFLAAFLAGRRLPAAYLSGLGLAAYFRADFFPS